MWQHRVKCVLHATFYQIRAVYKLLQPTIISSFSIREQLWPSTKISFKLLPAYTDPRSNKDEENLTIFYRAISYLFSWHKEKMIFKDIPHESFSADFTDNLLLGLLHRIQVCIQQYGELGCLYQTHGEDGNLEVSIVYSALVCYACCL